MKNRIIRFGIASPSEVQRRMHDTMKGKRKPKPRDPKIWFESYQALAQVLSSKNRKLLSLIREADIQSIKHLADLSGRHVSNLHNTLKMFESYGLVKIIDGGRGKKIPKVTFDKIEITDAIDADIAA